MTVSTITGLPADVKRALDNSNKPASQKNDEVKSQGGAPLPKDTISASAAASLDLNEAIVATQAQNREAAKATLGDEDFEQVEQAGESAQEQVLAQSKAALNAQTNKLPPNILGLLAE